MGEPVRYDGEHKRNDEIIRLLTEHFQLLPLCPEVAIGMGVPRPPIQLVNSRGPVRATGVANPGLDVTLALQDYARAIASQYPNLCGYVFKQRSPSCGVDNAAVFENGIQVATNGRGIHAAGIMDCLPGIPVAGEDDLVNADTREAFFDHVRRYAANNNRFN